MATPPKIKFHKQKIRERGVNHEIHKNMPQKFGAMQYVFTV